MADSEIQSSKKLIPQKRPKVLFFDVNETLLDLTTMKASIGKALGGRTDLLPLWFTTLLHYSLVTTAGNQYQDFGSIGVATLQMIARNNGIELSETRAQQAVKPLHNLQPYPEIKEALKLLKEEGFPLVALTNSSFQALNDKFRNAGLYDLFDHQFSIEAVEKFKPHPDVYTWAASKMNVNPSDCLMIAAHGWDIAGALWAGWRAAFINRPGQQLYPLAPSPEIIEPNLTLVAHKLVAMQK